VWVNRRLFVESPNFYQLVHTQCGEHRNWGVGEGPVGCGRTGRLTLPTGVRARRKGSKGSILRCTGRGVGKGVGERMRKGWGLSGTGLGLSSLVPRGRGEGDGTGKGGQDPEKEGGFYARVGPRVKSGTQMDLEKKEGRAQNLGGEGGDITSWKDEGLKDPKETGRV